MPADASPDVSILPEGADPRIPTLWAALDPVELAKQISVLSGSPWVRAVPEEVRIKVLRWHPARHCTFSIDIRIESGWRLLIGKVYAKDQYGGHVHQAMERLWQAGFDRTAEASIPEPIAYLPSLRLHLQEKIEGIEAKDVFRYGSERLRVVAAEPCARWLARFHARAPRQGRVLQVAKMLARSERWWGLVSEGGDDFASKSEQLLERLRTAAASLGEVPVCAGHGDFGSHNIIFATGRTVTFDWDPYDIADPARDVAAFIVSLGRQGLHSLGSIRALDEAAEVFLEAYAACGGSPVAAHLPFYKAALWLRGAKKDVKTKPLGWRQWAEAKLDEGLRILQR